MLCLGSDFFRNIMTEDNCYYLFFFTRKHNKQALFEQSSTSRADYCLRLLNVCISIVYLSTLFHQTFCLFE